MTTADGAAVGNSGGEYRTDERGYISIPKRIAIVKTNQRMVSDCDYLIAYAWHHMGGSGQIVEYARKREKRGLIHVENLAEKLRGNAL